MVKLIILIIILTIITASAYSIFFSETLSNDNTLLDFENGFYNTIENNSTNTNEKNETNGLLEEYDFIHYVFLEAGTTVCCEACAQVADYLNDFFLSGEYPFYYVSLPDDNEKASTHLNRYNIYGYPTVYFDGGYEVIMGALDWQTVFKEKISSALAREIPEILINTSARWQKNENEIHIDVLIENYDEAMYSGFLRVYLTEIISTQWQGDQPNRFSFLEFALENEVTIPSQANISKNIILDSKLYDPENLMIFSVLFNSEKHTSYSAPPTTNPFDAYYADTVAATRVVEGGNLPPEVTIRNPQIGYHHRFGQALRESQLQRTIVLGRTTIIAEVTDDSSIERVEFYIDEHLMKTITTHPYEWTWHKFALGWKTLEVKAYDETGKSSTAKMDLWVLIKWQNPIARFFNIQ